MNAFVVAATKSMIVKLEVLSVKNDEKSIFRSSVHQGRWALHRALPFVLLVFAESVSQLRFLVCREGAADNFRVKLT